MHGISLLCHRGSVPGENVPRMTGIIFISRMNIGVGTVVAWYTCCAMYWVTEKLNFDSWHVQDNFVFSTASRPALCFN